MSVVILIGDRDLIGDREAIPVRAIPFVTGWLMSPDAVASSLALEDVLFRFTVETRLADDLEVDEQPTKAATLRAWHRAERGSVVEVLPKEWDRIARDMAALHEALEASGRSVEERWPDWRRASIQVLPATAFVWKDLAPGVDPGAPGDRLRLER
jgi:hypothetical protein